MRVISHVTFIFYCTNGWNHITFFILGENERDGGEKMSNPFEAFWNILKSSSGQESPLHIGEVMTCWTYFTAMKDMLRFEETV